MPVIWLHAVSVGETRAAEPLIKALLLQYPNHQILLTHTTPTGRATSVQLFGNSVSRVYLPYDTPSAVNRFLKHFKPVVGVLMETELWFNLMASCKQKSIPLLLMNARLSEKSARGYAKLGKVVQEGLQNLSAIAAQTTQDAERLQNLGAQHVVVAGNLKFDVTPPADAHEKGQQLRNTLGAERPVFLAASTRDGEEIMILEAVTKANIPNLLTVIVPRHPQRFNEVGELIKKYDANFIRRSNLANKSATQAFSYMLGDSMGEMFTYYACCDIAFIGGSLLPFGGQNLIEACAMGKPVLIGPYTFNFEQATTAAIHQNAAERVDDIDHLSHSLSLLLSDHNRLKNMSLAAASYSKGSAGATVKIINLIKMHI